MTEVSAQTVEKIYPALIPEYYRRLAQPGADPVFDPILRQCVPDPVELSDLEASPDPYLEEGNMPVPRLIRRYHDRAVLLSTGRCAMRCRFCFRKRYWRTGSDLPDITAEQFDRIIEYLDATPDVKEVLISGGDPLTMSSDCIVDMVERVGSVSSIEAVRLASRLPVVDPLRLDPELPARLRGKCSLWLMTHFNHPSEVTDEAAAACALFVDNGIPVLNQTVLLSGINDDAEILSKLFRKLVGIRVKPHYLFHVDPVLGVRHFATGVERGLELMRELRERLSSLSLPVYAIDLPGGGGKIRLEPDLRDDQGRYPTCDGKWIYYSKE